MKYLIKGSTPWSDILKTSRAKMQRKINKIKSSYISNKKHSKGLTPESSW